VENKVHRIFVEKKAGFDVEAQTLFHEIFEGLGLETLQRLRVINRYDIEGISKKEFEDAKWLILSEKTVDQVWEQEYPIHPEEVVFAIEYLPGQYDQRADSASQCIQMLTLSNQPLVRTAKLILLEGSIKGDDLERIKAYCINPLESREAKIHKPLTLQDDFEVPENVQTIKGFMNYLYDELLVFHKDKGLAMTMEDLLFCQKYFKNTEKRDPTITELMVLDTYWSDHCRHTTFLTKIEDVQIEEGPFKEVIEKAYHAYLEDRTNVHGEEERDLTLMDLATIKMKEMKKNGEIPDLDLSDEINACSIKVDVDIDGENQEWLVMFKNETHNHPTEVEPFGGAATCLGGAIRDPLSGRSYVYQAMRVTGSGDPRVSFDKTIPGKLPQRKITTGAAKGYSSYGNQIGLATGHVSEIYHEDYVAKRMEIGAVVGAVPLENVHRKKPRSGDVVILLGGRTGRDGCGGATGSSKGHTEESIVACAAEVQKGNPPTERKIQRLFRNPVVSRMIKKCNDFGAGGVSVAIGELAEGLFIDLDAIPKKYQGLDGTELAISESQERMAVVLDRKHLDGFIQLAGKENLEATKVAVVTDDKRLKMVWKGKIIVDVSREFLDTNGVKQTTKLEVKSPLENGFFQKFHQFKDLNVTQKIWEEVLSDLNVCSQKGLAEMFDSTIGAGTINMPFGGKYQLSPETAMIAKIPVLSGETKMGTIMAHGFNPYISSWSPFHGGVYALVEAITKVVSNGGNYRKIRLSLQEYFEKPGKYVTKWGRPFSALLGAHYVQSKLQIPAIGGKDSMSGNFKDLSVPPTLVAFALSTIDVSKTITATFQKVGNRVLLLEGKMSEDFLPDFDVLKEIYLGVYKSIQGGKIYSARPIGHGGMVEAVSKMAFGNKIGFKFQDRFLGSKLTAFELLYPSYGSIVVEVDQEEDVEALFPNLEVKTIGYTMVGKNLEFKELGLELEDLIETWQKPLEDIFPTTVYEPQVDAKAQEELTFRHLTPVSRIKIEKPKVFIPVFPGTNCEVDTGIAFTKAGAEVDTFILNNLSPEKLKESILEMARRIKEAHIIAIPGGFSGGDEPDGAGKFIATVFRNAYVKNEVMELLKNRDGLILGICNGFQALIKLGLLPFGEIRDIEEDFPTLTYNSIGRHVSRMVRTKVVSDLSPWLSKTKLGDIHTIPVSHGEGRFVVSPKEIENLFHNGQIATQYVDFKGKESSDIEYNPNGSLYGVEGITSRCGRIFGKMGHSERVGKYVCKNVPGDKDQNIFAAGIGYYL
jgi:phosphoribosylformylglycinamidine synthase